MSEITDEQQIKINRLMYLKYKRHRRIMAWTWFFIVLYSVLVFFLLVHFHQVEYYLNGNFVIVLAVGFGIGIIFSLFGDENNDMMSKHLDKSMIVFACILGFLFIVFGSLTGVFNGGSIPIENVFLIFVVFVLGYFLLCFFSEKMITKNTLLFVYFIFYSIFLFPVLSQAVTNLAFLGILGNFLLGMSPLLLLIFRASLADFLCSGYFIRKLFLKKDSEIWNCPQCHCHIMRKPFWFCPHCGNVRLGSSFYCENCGFSTKIKDFDFPNYCPHCGLSFRRRKARK